MRGRQTHWSSAQFPPIGRLSPGTKMQQTLYIYPPRSHRDWTPPCRKRRGPATGSSVRTTFWGSESKCVLKSMLPASGPPADSSSPPDPSVHRVLEELGKRFSKKQSTNREGTAPPLYAENTVCFILLYCSYFPIFLQRTSILCIKRCLFLKG